MGFLTAFTPQCLVFYRRVSYKIKHVSRFILYVYFNECMYLNLICFIGKISFCSVSKVSVV